MAAAKKAAGKQAITLHDHIKELRNRFFVVALVFVIASSVAYNFKDTLIYYLLKPLGNEKLIYLNPAGGFSFIFQVTMYVGVAVAIPFLVFNLYRFVAPALPERARQHSLLVMVSSIILLCCGVTFGYVFAIPGALNFLTHFADGYITASLTADSYLNFILAYTAGLGILFQLPLVLLVVHWIYPLKPLKLLKFERYMILLAFIGAAMITPTPDVMNQVIMALPIILMYQAGVIAICISIFRTKRRNRPPKVSRRERQQAKIHSKKIKQQPVVATQPVQLPQLSDVVPATTLAPKTINPAKQSHRITEVRRVRAHDIVPVMKPAFKKQIVVQQNPSPSQTRKSMDIMMAPNQQSHIGERGAIGRTERPLHHRTPVLQVPKRASTIDGISVV